MRITVIGGTGLIGRKLVALLDAQGHDVIAAARSTGVNTVTGEGLAGALRGTQTVVDVSNSGYASIDTMQRFFETSGANLLAAERLAEVDHHVALSAVGIDGLSSTGYFRAKLAQEKVVAASPIPFTIVRSTPFFEFIYSIVDSGGDGDTIRLPPILMQPIAADDVAKALARIAIGAPLNATIEIAGPDTYRLPALAEEILTANEDARQVIVDADAPYLGTRVGNGQLIGGEHPRFGSTDFSAWLRHSIAV